ncbi:hypothetical protein Zmor_021703 [Zophobas morio]|uniref:Uncharacterized protein n=1 Tax=Zophobas morio TaxID=2755281 RepID=A0AA38I6N1_9CUCU|nr:hypothetical protein Zmor_021703 [Zophobas morio]
MAGNNSNKTINKKRNRWFDDQCEAELEKHNKLRLKMLTQRTKETSYLKQRKICKAVIQEKKRRHYEDKLKDIEEKYKNNLVRNLYRGIRNEKRGYQAQLAY